MVRIPVNAEEVADFCRRWRIRELSLFGSVLRDDFRPDSDVDVLVVFEEGIGFGWVEWERMEQELAGIFGRRVDLVEKEAVTNPFRRHHILKTHRVLYAA